MDIHVFPIPIPSPTSLSTRSLWVFPVQKVWALVSCIQPGLVICFTLDNIHVSMLFSGNMPPSPSPTESESLLCTPVSWLFHAGDIVALQCCLVSSVQRQASAVCTYIPLSAWTALSAPHPTRLDPRRAPNWAPRAYRRFPLAADFTRGRVDLSVPSSRCCFALQIGLLPDLASPWIPSVRADQAPREHWLKVVLPAHQKGGETEM